jgi:hypothetical protein
MRFPFSRLVPFALVSTVAFACGGGDDAPTDAAGTGGATGGPSGTPVGPFDAAKAANGMPVGESAACNEIHAAMSSTIAMYQCSFPAPLCPELLRTLPGGASCAQYDQGVIDACAKYIPQLSCDRLKGNPCMIAPLAGSAGMGCTGGKGGAAGASPMGGGAMMGGGGKGAMGGSGGAGGTAGGAGGTGGAATGGAGGAAGSGTGGGTAGMSAGGSGTGGSGTGGSGTGGTAAGNGGKGGAGG